MKKASTKQKSAKEQLAHQSAPVSETLPREVVVQEEEALAEVQPEPKKEAKATDRVAESRKILEHPLPAGQKLFETPDGEIIIGEADKGQVWSRTMNHGKGGWANPRR